jgi:signal transduction histidine kinase
MWEGRPATINFIRDIQKRKEAEEELFRKERLASLGVLSAGIAHEINNPVAFVNVNAATIEKWWTLLEPIFDRAVALGWDHELDLAKLSQIRTKFPKMIQAIKEGTARVSTITNALRRFARSDHEEKKMVDIVKILEQASVITKNQYKYQADLVIDNNPQIPPILGNFQKLEQVFINLIINAVDAIKEKGEAMKPGAPTFRGLIEINTALLNTTERKVKITVKDNGIGMDPHIVSKIFDPFFTSKTEGKGTGLGLSVVYGIVDEHGGKISAKSTKGVSTEFTVLLPVESHEWNEKKEERADRKNYNHER